jgi:aminomethyltransferase
VQEISWKGQKIYLSTTGYTGSGGCEVLGDSMTIVALWEVLLRKNIAPIGLGARDTLRLEMGYALYGHEISDTISPTEAVCRWAVKLQKNHFIGKEALEHLESKRRFPAALRLQGKGIAREGAAVVFENNVIGRVTSGSFSPSLQCGIALALIDRFLEIGTVLSIEVRGQALPVEAVQLPFYKINRIGQET